MNATPSLKTASGRPLITLGATGCQNCRVFKACGGHPLPLIFKLGCANYNSVTNLVDNDNMDPRFDDRFWERWDDVGGLDDYTVGKLKSVTAKGFPRYLPMLQGKQVSRSRTLDLPMVALPLFHILVRRKNGGYGPKFPSGAALRAAYKLRPDTRILLVGVDKDRPLETFWAKHRSQKIGQALMPLDLLGVTAPNFSYFTDVPGFQILRNCKRMLLSVERLSKAGVRTSPHLNANTLGHWRFWLQFLRDHPEVKTLTVEFQTGALEKQEVGREIFDGLINLQNCLGRPIHCFLVGGGRFYREACEKLKSFTVIDSQPYMQATKRRVLMPDSAGGFSWKKSLTKIGAPIVDLFETSLLYYEDKLNNASEEEIESPVENTEPESERQTFMPYLTAQPLAPGISEMNSAATVACQAETVCHAPAL
jgi:hypothetical protein